VELLECRFVTKKKANPQTAGRPTKYLPKYCTEVVEWGKAGKSRIWMCAEMGVVERTMITWEEKHPEFLQAMEVAMLHSQQWWEDAGQKGMTAPGFNGSVFSRSMAARFPRSWREKLEVTPGLPDLSGFSKDELDALDAIAAKAARFAVRGNPD
jgi:hypothetical protein